MKLVYQIQISKNHGLYEECDRLTFASKNLYNQALYRIKNHYEEFETYLNYYELVKQFTEENQVDYRNLATQAAQQTLIILEQNWKSYFKTIKSWKKNPTKFKSMPLPPNFLNKTKGRFIATFTSQTISKKSYNLGFIGLMKSNFLLEIPKHIQKINQVRIIPKLDFFNVEVIYEKEVEQRLISDNYVGIDLGVNNLATIAYNKSEFKPFILNGKPVKSMNQFYNKKKAELQSKLPKAKNGKQRQTSKKIKKLTEKRNSKIKDYLHKASRKIVDKLKQEKITSIVIGKNTNWKQSVNLGSKNNQNFCSIPYNIFINMISYKAELLGIEVKQREESYTSKCSFFDNESVRKHNTYLGKRDRKAFWTSNKTLINADYNGALNILKKEFPNVFTDGIEGLLLNPFRIYI